VRELLGSGMSPVAPTIENSIGMRLVLVPAGSFWMGSPDDVGHQNEHPRHQVEILRPFYLGAFPVTQEQYERVTGANPGSSPVPHGGSEAEAVGVRRFPVDYVSWDDAVAFCEALSKLPDEKKAGRTYRLPTEAEWEYSCRGGANAYSRFSFYHYTDDPDDLYGDTGPYDIPIHSTPVESLPANAFGLCGMHGNVCEWCADWFGESYYQVSPVRDPQGPDRGEWRVLRGGSHGLGHISHSAFRDRLAPTGSSFLTGFRVCFRPALPSSESLTS
jgi:formylglycine-generating enzyme required for sulfatase activity